MTCRTEFKGRTAIVTGSASGIGRATGAYLASLGTNVALVDTDLPGLEDLAREIAAQGGPKPLFAKINVADEKEVDGFVKDTVRTFGGVDYLVTSAGVLRRTQFLEMSIPEWDLVVGVNLRGTFLFCHAVAPLMAARKRGAIVTVSSLAGRSVSVFGNAAYTSSKAGVIGLTRHIARELGPQGVRVNCFCPGGTLTAMILRNTTKESQDSDAEKRPLRRWASPEEQARIITFLLSDEAGYITGACLDSNGGALMV